MKGSFPTSNGNNLHYDHVVSRVRGEFGSAPSVLLLPPNPHLGATMDNAIIIKTAGIFQERNFNVLRINYSHNNDDDSFTSEDGISDATHAMNWLSDKHQDCKVFWIVGYSFGAEIAAQLVMRRPEIIGFLLISPLIVDNDFSFLSPCPSRGIAIYGSEDKFVSHDDSVKKLKEKFNRNGKNSVEFREIVNANHFYKDHERDLLLGKSGCDKESNIFSCIEKYLDDRILNDKNIDNVKYKSIRRRRRAPA